MALRTAILAALMIGTAGMTLAAERRATTTAEPARVSAMNSEEQAIDRANKLLAEMTLEEKAGQVSQQFAFSILPPVDGAVRDGLGSVLFVSDAAETNRLQRIAMTETRLKIPLLFGFDVIHGFRTIFPAPLGMAASFDPAIAERSQAAAAAEARAAGIHWTFAPMVDIARDPRWGRIVEGAGEDPFLGGKMAAAQVRGFQGDHIGAPGHVISGPKHFAGYGAASGGRDYDAASISDADLHNVYLPPFKAAIDAGAGNIMSAYMDLNDVPAAANRWLLGDVLRGEFGFKGWVVSDAHGVHNLVKQHLATDDADAAVRALAAGNDMEMSIGKNAFAALPDAVRSGRLPMKVLDDSVRRILVAKIRMGLFENPYVDETRAEATLADPAHRALAQMAAERSLVLLKNDGGLLPLAPGAHKRVAVIGPLADSAADIIGPWTFKENAGETVTLAAGVRERLKGVAEVTSAAGVELKRQFPSPFAAFKPGPKPWEAGRAETEYAKALDLARNADLIILALGEAQDMSGERASRADLKLPGRQRALFDAVRALGKPVVLVLVNGRPLDLTGMVDHAPAILEAWYPGTRGGTAVARALFGDVNPGGKLPVTWPRSVGQVPIYYAHNTSHQPESAGERYWDEASTPLFPFGHGLSYTSFTLAEPELDQATMPADGAITVTTSLTNTGTRAGDEVVQLYIHQRSGRASRPVRQLRGFERVALKPGETRKVTFRLTAADLRYWNAVERAWVADPGQFDLWVGTDANAAAHASFTFEATGR